MNDHSDSTMGGTTRGIELCGMINIPRAKAQSDSRRNVFFSRPITASRGKKNNTRVNKGTFRQFCDEVHIFLLVWACRIYMNKTQ